LRGKATGNKRLGEGDAGIDDEVGMWTFEEEEAAMKAMGHFEGRGKLAIGTENGRRGK